MVSTDSTDIGAKGADGAKDGAQSKTGGYVEMHSAFSETHIDFQYHIFIIMALIVKPYFATKVDIHQTSNGAIGRFVYGKRSNHIVIAALFGKPYLRVDAESFLDVGRANHL